MSTPAPALRVFHIHDGEATECAQAPQQMPAEGYVWLACSRRYFGEQLAAVQAALQNLTGMQLVDLHVSDLLNAQLPSHYDYTSQYDLLVIRRIASPPDKASNAAVAEVVRRARAKAADDRHWTPPTIDTIPVGFAVWDRVLLSVHPDDCSVRDSYAQRLLQLAGAPAPAGAPAAAPDLAALSRSTQDRLAREDQAQRIPGRIAAQRLPLSPADLMMRMVNLIVDGYLDLRRELSRHLDLWQNALLKPRGRFADWSALLEARLALHHLDEICEDQRAAVQDWVDTVEAWPTPPDAAGQRALEVLRVRSRDVLEHIERVVHHVRRLEQNTETAVQMHFNVQSNRANDIMRTLTTITAIFLPLNLIAAIFGMNFEFIPFVHARDGFWWAMGTMGVIALVLIGYFSRKHYLARTEK
ncbi:magnesium transporter CorA family protein [Comamonas humi]